MPEGIELAEELQQVFIDVEIEPIPATQVFNVTPEINGLDETLTATVDIEEMSVVLFGPREAIKTITDDDVRANIDLFGLVTGTHIITPTVDQPIQSIEVQSVQPEQISVEITANDGLQLQDLLDFSEPVQQTYVIISGTEVITVTGVLSGTEIVTSTNTITDDDAFRPKPTAPLTTVPYDSSDKPSVPLAFAAAAPSYQPSAAAHRTATHKTNE